MDNYIQNVLHCSSFSCHLIKKIYWSQDDVSLRICLWFWGSVTAHWHLAALCFSRPEGNRYVELGWSARSSPSATGPSALQKPVSSLLPVGRWAGCRDNHDSGINISAPCPALSPQPWQGFASHRVMPLVSGRRGCVGRRFLTAFQSEKRGEAGEPPTGFIAQIVWVPIPPHTFPPTACLLPLHLKFFYLFHLMGKASILVFYTLKYTQAKPTPGELFWCVLCLYQEHTSTYGCIPRESSWRRNTSLLEK